MTLNGIIAESHAAKEANVTLASYAGDIKAIFSGGSFYGEYEVINGHGIGHEGIVVDNTPTTARSGTVGDGNATLRVYHTDGNVALALSTKAPSVFAGITGGLGGSGGPKRWRSSGGGQECHEEEEAVRVGATEWMVKAGEWMAEG